MHLNNIDDNKEDFNILIHLIYLIYLIIPKKNGCFKYVKLPKKKFRVVEKFNYLEKNVRLILPIRSPESMNIA